jgi:hypothetical protein
MKEHVQTYKFYLNQYFLRKALNRATLQIFEVMLEETLNHSV